MTDTQQISSRTETEHELIARGPSKFELMLALFDHTMSNGRTVSFAVGNGAATMHDDSGRELLTGVTPVNVAINEVGRESGDGESWLFEGYLSDGSNTLVEGYYSTRTNTG